jgi:hypothetical protein
MSEEEKQEKKLELYEAMRKIDEVDIIRKD